jgi:hypothetical protein
VIVLRWYELDPRHGRLRQPPRAPRDGEGLGQVAAARGLAVEEFAGPTCFGGWDEDGEPVGVLRYWPVVEIAAVSEDQTDNTYAAIYEMLDANEHRAAKALGVDIGLTRMYLTGGPGRAPPRHREVRSREGARLTFAVLDETHLWFSSNGGTKLAATLRRNAAKMDGRTFETTNAPGARAQVRGRGSATTAAPGRAAHRPPAAEMPRSDMADERAAGQLRYVYGDSWWAPIDRILKEIRDPATSWDDALRFYFNVRSAGKSRAVDPRQWDALGPPTVPARDIPAGARVGLGFDGSLSLDSTVLRACTPDGYSFSLPGWSWVRPTGDAMTAWALAHPGEDWRVPATEVDAAVAQRSRRFNVGLMRPDAAFWRDEITRWQRLYGDEVVVPFDTNSRASWRRPSTAGAPPSPRATTPTTATRSCPSTSRRCTRRTRRRRGRGDDGRTPVVPSRATTAARSTAASRTSSPTRRR